MNGVIMTNNIGLDQGNVYATAWPYHPCSLCGVIIHFHAEILFYVTNDYKWWCGHHIEAGLAWQKQLEVAR